MAKLLFRLRNVPEDEAAEVRELLREHAIDFYETEPGNWGISMPAIWVRDNAQLEHAKQLLITYQDRRRTLARQEHEMLKQNGQHPTIMDRFRENPLRFTLYVGFILIIVYISISIFF
jgi:hypothetical protein